MRRRLTVTLVALVAGALLVAGAGSLVVTHRAARAEATRQLLRQGRDFASAAGQIRTPLVVRTLGRVLHLEDSTILLLGPSGRPARPVGPRLAALDLPTRALMAGRAVSGSRGDLVFAAVPMRLSPSIPVPPGDRPVLVMTRRIGTLLPGWTYLVLVGGLTLLVTALVAEVLSRRIARPIVDASEATRRIAGGELSARVEVRDTGIEEVDSLAGSVNAMAARLQLSRQRESQLLLSVSHDLRTPLTSIRGYAEAIEEGAAEDPGRAAAVIVAESRRLERLVADLLDLAKLENDHLSLRLGPVEANGVLEASLAGAAPAAGRRGLHLAAAGASDPVVVVADEDRLAQVVGNLLQNALEHARSDVRAGVGTDGGPNGLVWVEDDGPGIPPEDHERVFDRFYQVDRGAAARPGGGSGLGLSIVSELVKAMGGAIRVDSPTGATGGTRMVVALPLADALTAGNGASPSPGAS